MYPRAITDRKHRLFVTPQIDEATQGSIVVDRGQKSVGIYLDDSTPNLHYWVDKARKSQWSYKFVSVSMNDMGRYWDGMDNLLEWYPYHAGWNPGEMPRSLYRGYILQWRYPGYILAQDPTSRVKPPNIVQRHKLLIQALRRHPQFIFYY